MPGSLQDYSAKAKKCLIPRARKRDVWPLKGITVDVLNVCFSCRFKSHFGITTLMEISVLSLFECLQVVILAVLANPQSQLLVRDPSKTTTNANQIRKTVIFGWQEVSGSEEKETGVVYLLDNDKREDWSEPAFWKCLQPKKKKQLGNCSRFDRTWLGCIGCSPW